MVNPVEESEDEEDMDEQPKRKKQRSSRATTAIASSVGEASSSKPPIKTGRRPEKVWKYVDKLEGNRFRCKRCKQEYSGGATRIKIHLGISNGTGIKRCEKLKKRKKKKRKRNLVPSSDQQGVVDGAITTTNSPDRQPQSDDAHDSPVLPEYPNSEPITPLSQSPSSPNTTHNMDDVQLRTSDPIALQEAPLTLEMEVEKHVQAVKESWSKYGFTLKIHLRKNLYKEFPKKSDVLGYTVYCPKGLVFLDAQTLPDEVGKAMEKEVTQILFDLDHGSEPQHALFLCANNMVFFEGSKSVSICAHGEVLELLNRVVEESEWISGLLVEAKQKYDVLCRREKDILMASKFEHPFSVLQIITQYKNQLEGGLPAGRSETFWEDGEEVLSAVKPLLQILSIFDSCVPNIGYLYEAIEIAEKRIEHHQKANPVKFKELWEQFGLLKSCLIQPIHVTSAYLDPSYVLDNKDKINDEEVREYLKEFMVESEEETALDNDLARYSSKNSLLFTEEAISLSKTYHPVRWWDEFGEPTPVLKRCAIRLLSQLSNCLAHLRYKPKFEELKFEGLDVLRLNVTMMEEFKELEEKDMIFKPIDLSTLDVPLN